MLFFADEHDTWLLYMLSGQGRFDAGWDALREETFARQKQMGIIPANAQLTKRPKEIASTAVQPGHRATIAGTFHG